MAPKFVDKKERQKEIALIALDLFAEKGFEATSMSQIAWKARIGKGTVYLYFDSKEELIFSSLMAWIELLTHDREMLLQKIDDPIECLHQLICVSIKKVSLDKRTLMLMVSLIQMLITEKKFFSKYDVPRKIFQNMSQAIIRVLLDGVSKGLFRPEIAEDAEKVAINILAYLDGIVLHYHMNRNYFDLMTQVEFFLDQLLQELKP